MEDFEWNVINEGHLLDAMAGHKPVGINKYFQMAFICDKFTEGLAKDINPDKIWAHLATMYNLEALDESEAIPFPNSEQDFFLPQSEFGTLMSRKDEEKGKTQTARGGRETPKLKEAKKEEKTPTTKNQKEHRDSKDGKDNNKTAIGKKEIKKDAEKSASKGLGKGRVSSVVKEERLGKKLEELPKVNKRPTRGSLKSNDDSGSSGKSSPVNTPIVTGKRRRI